MEPKDFARVILRRKRTVAIAVFIVMASVLFASARKDPMYVAECQVLFQATGMSITEPSRPPVETVGTLESNRDLFKSPVIAQPTAERLQLTPAQLAASPFDVVITAPTQIFKLTVVDQGLPHPLAGEGIKPEWSQNPAQRAGDLCNAYAEEYIEFKKQEASQVFETDLTRKEASLGQRLKEYGEIQDQLDRAKNRKEAFSLEIRRDTLLLRISDLQGEVVGLREQLEDGITGGGKLIAEAGLGRLIGADRMRDLGMGLMVGLIFGIGIALVREYLDDTVKDKESTQRELGLPVLAALPAVDDIDGLDEPSTGTIEAARNLRATLASIGFPHDKNMLVVTSSLAKRRATTLASLAGAVAESGRSVLVIGSDLRGGRTHEAFGIHNSVGLANVVRGQVAFEKAIRPAPGLDGVYVMPAGPIIGNPGELLSSEAMAVVLRRARRWADVVLLDAPPVLNAADSSILGAYSDGVLLVVSAGQTNRAQANEAKEQLIAAGARVLGVVLVGTEEHQHDDFHDDLSMGTFGDWGTGHGAVYDVPAYDPEMDDPWFDESQVSLSAYTEQRPAPRRRAPQKKVAASRPGQRPARSRQQSVPRSGVRTAGGTRGSSTSARRSPARKGSSATTRAAKTARATNGRTTKARAANGRAAAGRRTTSRTATKKTRSTGSKGNGARRTR